MIDALRIPQPRSGCSPHRPGVLAPGAESGDDGAVDHPQTQPERPHGIDRRHPIAKRIIARWRQLIVLTGGRSAGEPTLIACSGGADSTALALALGSTGIPLTLLFAEHDARDRSDVLQDRARVEQLAKLLGSEFSSVNCSGLSSGQPSEGEMRAARYGAIAEATRSLKLRFVATGHQADDQLETMLISLIRGGGPSGMAGIPETRRLDPLLPEVHLLRPMLAITRAECETLCMDAGLHRPGEGEPAWAQDQTNAEAVYLRNRVRHEIVPLLSAIRPGVAIRASRNAEWFRQLESVLHQRATAVSESAACSAGAGSRVWSRRVLGAEPAIVLGELLRIAMEDRRDGRGLDRLDAEKVGRISEAVADDSTDPRVFEIGDGWSVVVRASEVELRMKKPRDERG